MVRCPTSNCIFSLWNALEPLLVNGTFQREVILLWGKEESANLFHRSLRIFVKLHYCIRYFRWVCMEVWRWWIFRHVTANGIFKCLETKFKREGPERLHWTFPRLSLGINLLGTVYHRDPCTLWPIKKCPCHYFLWSCVVSAGRTSLKLMQAKIQNFQEGKSPCNNQVISLPSGFHHPLGLPHRFYHRLTSVPSTLNSNGRLINMIWKYQANLTFNWTLCGVSYIRFVRTYQIASSYKTPVTSFNGNAANVGPDRPRLHSGQDEPLATGSV